MRHPLGPAVGLQFASTTRVPVLHRGLSLVFAAGVALACLLGATPAHASSFSVLVGDKDGFGLGLTPGQQIPCLTSIANPASPFCFAPIHDLRSAAEQLATNGAQLTDVYSALYSGVEHDCPTGCSPNGDTGAVIFPLSAPLTSASITMFLGDFESTLFGAMSASINGIPISFAFDHGFRQTALVTIVLTPQMIAAANLAGQVTLFLDHRAFFDPINPANSFGSFDYIMFDYFELNANPVPEPGTMALLGAGLVVLMARRYRRLR